LSEGQITMKAKTTILLMLVFAVILIVLSSAALGQGQPADKDTAWNGTTEQKIWGLMTVWSEAKYNFPFFEQRPGLNWDEKVKEYLPRVIAAPDMESYYDVLCEFAALLKDGHTAVNRPGGLFNPTLDWPPLEVQVVDGKYIVARFEETAELKRNRIHCGLEIVEIEGVPADSYFRDRVVRYESRGTRQADQAINIYRLLMGPKGSEVKLKVRDLDGREWTVVLSRNSATKVGRPFFTRLFEWYMNTSAPVEARMMKDGIVYIKIANFDSEQVVKEFMKTFDSIAWPSVKGVMLDIRYNPGGDDTFAFPVIGCFFDAPVRSFLWKSPKYVPAKASWGFKPEWEQGPIGPEFIQPRQGFRYLGPLVILTGPTTYSTAEDFVIPFDFLKRAVLVGETTAGSTGNPHRVPLPGGGNFRVVTLRTLYPDGREWVGVGIKPLVQIHPTQQDIFKGNDAVLNKGLEVLKNWEQYHTRHPEPVAARQSPS
jgi:carboxyl-terminal processing protease